MKKRLQDTIAAIHSTKITDMYDLVATTPIRFSSGAFFYESAAIAGKEEGLFSTTNGIWV